MTMKFPLNEKEIVDILYTGDFSDREYSLLYDYYQEDMPYGTQKARTGDPYQWIYDRLEEDYGYLFNN